MLIWSLIRETTPLPPPYIPVPVARKQLLAAQNAKPLRISYTDRPRHREEKEAEIKCNLVGTGKKETLSEDTMKLARRHSKNAALLRKISKDIYPKQCEVM